MSDYKSKENSVNQAYVELWGSMQGALHPYVKALMPLVGRSLVDEEFRKRFLADPEAVFAEENLEFQDGLKVEVVEDSQELRHLVLPPLIESIPAQRMDIFNQLLNSGTLNTWGQDDSDTGNVARSAGVPTGADGSDTGDPSTDSWHPF